MTERRLFTPPHEITISRTTPLVFLEGPVQGAPDWQNEVATRLLALRDDIAVASPRRTPEDQARFNSREQVAWEHASIRRARQFGALGIWWAAQDLDDHTYPAGRAYAQTTRFEAGDAIAENRNHPSLPLIIGYDPRYSSNGGGSESYSRLILELEGLDVPVAALDEFVDGLVEKTPRLQKLYPEFSHKHRTV